MTVYKFQTDRREDGVIKDGITIIPNHTGNRHWQEFLEWEAAGNTALPYKSEEELREDALRSKLYDLKEELDFRVSSLIPSSKSRNQAKMVSRAAKLLRKELKGTLTASEKDELDLMDTLEDLVETACQAFDDAEAWLEAPERTQEEIEAYDIVNTPLWNG